MMQSNIFLGMSPTAWADVFSVAKVLLPGLVMACFGAYYQLRKKAEVAVKVGIARLRISAYTEIAEEYSILAEQVSPTLADEAEIKEILGCIGVNDMNTDYSKAIGTEAGFDNFYQEICRKERENEIYLDHDVKKQCRSAVAVFTEMKQFLDAYSDTERSMCQGTNADAVQHRINFAYQFAAILLKNEINKASLLVGDTIARQINGISVNYKKHYIDRFCNKAMDSLLRWADNNMSAASWKGRLSHFILSRTLRSRQPLMLGITRLVRVMPCLHLSPYYTPTEYFTMDDPSLSAATSEFMQNLYMQLHHNR